MEEVFGCETWADASALIAEGMVIPSGGRRPDFVCTFADGSLGIFEAKGTTGTAGDLTSALASGKLQAGAITADTPIKYRVVVGVALYSGAKPAKVILLDPPPNDPTAKPTNLTADLVKRAAMEMRTLRPSATSLLKGGTETPPFTKGGQGGSAITIFRGPTGEIRLKRDDYRDEKKHGWLDIT